MKTTIELPDELMREVRECARSSGTTMRELMVEGLRGELARRREARPRADFVFHAVDGEGLRADVDARDVIARSYGMPDELIDP